MKLAPGVTVHIGRHVYTDEVPDELMNAESQAANRVGSEDDAGRGNEPAGISDRSDWDEEQHSL